MNIIENADLSDRAVNQISDVIVPMIKERDKEIERLNNIINKGIEYIQDRYDGEVLTHTFDKCNVGELLEILEGRDKE